MVEIFLYRVILYVVAIMRIEENEIIDKNYLQVKNARIESLEETRNELFEKLAAVGLEFVLVQLQNKIKIENSKIVYDYSSKNVDNMNMLLILHIMN